MITLNQGSPIQWSQVEALILLVGWLLEFLHLSNNEGQIRTDTDCDNVYSWQRYSAKPKCETRQRVSWPNIPLSYIILTLRLPVLALS